MITFRAPDDSRILLLVGPRNGILCTFRHSASIHSSPHNIIIILLILYYILYALIDYPVTGAFVGRTSGREKKKPRDARVLCAYIVCTRADKRFVEQIARHKGRGTDNRELHFAQVTVNRLHIHIQTQVHCILQKTDAPKNNICLTRGHRSSNVIFIIGCCRFVDDTL